MQLIRCDNTSARNPGASPWTKSAPPSAEHPNSAAGSGWMRPPHVSLSIVTLLPTRPSSRAVIKPAAPAPTTMIWSACCLAMLVASLEFRVIDQATVALWGAAIAPQDNCATEFFARL